MLAFRSANAIWCLLTNCTCMVLFYFWFVFVSAIASDITSVEMQVQKVTSNNVFYFLL